MTEIDGGAPLYKFYVFLGMVKINFMANQRAKENLCQNCKIVAPCPVRLEHRGGCWLKLRISWPFFNNKFNKTNREFLLKSNSRLEAL